MTAVRATWREPGSLLPLRWGSYTGRYLAGLGFIAGGLVVLVGTNTYTVYYLLVGTVVHTAGWFVMPGPGLRRVWVTAPSLIGVWVMLTGPQSLLMMFLPLLAWLFVRQRPVRSYLTVLLPILSGVWIANTFHSSHNEPTAFAIQAIVVCGSAWIARFLAMTRSPRRRLTGRASI